MLWFENLFVIKRNQIKKDAFLFTNNMIFVKYIQSNCFLYL